MTETPAGSPMIQLEGYYQGQNLYVQNPFAPDGTSFCAYEVYVNGAVTADAIRASAFEIDLKAFRFKIGDKVTVQIFHQNGCTPKVINPEVLKPGAVSATNKLRVKQTGDTGAPKTSPTVSFASKKPAVTFIYDEADKTISFSAKTDWEIYDGDGSIVKKGHGIRISVANLVEGGYYLSYDNTVSEFRVQ